jgi:hypothetical protein
MEGAPVSLRLFEESETTPMSSSLLRM